MTEASNVPTSHLTESMTPEQARAVMAEHPDLPHLPGDHYCRKCRTAHPCLPYRLAAAYLDAIEDRDRESERYRQMRTMRDRARAVLALCSNCRVGDHGFHHPDDDRWQGCPCREGDCAKPYRA